MSRMTSKIGRVKVKKPKIHDERRGWGLKKNRSLIGAPGILHGIGEKRISGLLV